MVKKTVLTQITNVTNCGVVKTTQILRLEWCTN